MISALQRARWDAAEGCRVRLVRLAPSSVGPRPGAVGTIAHIDDAGTVEVTWGDGSRSSLMYLAGDRFDYLACA